MKIADILKKPRLTEKSYLGIVENKYIFDVALHASKDDVRMAIEELYKVDVVSVRTMVNRGKKKVRGKNRKVVKTGKFKKAIVEIAEGQSIKTFDEIFKSESK